MKRLIFILMALLFIPAMATATVPDDDVGDKVEQLADQAELQLQVETSLDFDAIETFNVELEQPFHMFSRESDATLVLETSGYIDEHIDPGLQSNLANIKNYNSKNFNRIVGTAGALPYMC